MAEGWFTPRTAREALGSLKTVAESMCRLYRELERNRPARILPEQPVDATYFSLVSRLHARLGQIRRLGVQVKDVRCGLLDFPARRDGRRVLLCWKVGEGSLGFWHEMDSGFAGRKPVDEDGPWEEA